MTRDPCVVLKSLTLLNTIPEGACYSCQSHERQRSMINKLIFSIIKEPSGESPDGCNDSTQLQ